VAKDGRHVRPAHTTAEHAQGCQQHGQVAEHVIAGANPHGLHVSVAVVATARNNARAAVRFLERAPPDLREVREALACIVDDADRAGDIIDRIREHIKKAPP